MSKKGVKKRDNGYVSLAIFVSVLIALFVFLSFGNNITGFAISDTEAYEDGLVGQIQDQQLISETTDASENIEVEVKTAQYGAVLGSPVKWRKNITLSEPSSITIQLPEETINYSIIGIQINNLTLNETITNITSNQTIESNLTINETVSNQTSVNLTNQSNLNSLNQTIVSNNTNVILNNTVGQSSVGSSASSQGTASTNQSNQGGNSSSQVNQTQSTNNTASNSSSSSNQPGPSFNETISELEPELVEVEEENTSEIIEEQPEEVLREVEEVTSEEEENAEEIVEAEQEEIVIGITGEVVRSIKETSSFPFASFFQGLIRFVGFVVIGENNSTEEVVIEEEVTQVEVEYFTEAPYAIETETSEGKTVEIIGPDNLHYENVLAFTELNEELGINSRDLIKIYWEQNQTYLDFEVYDISENGIYDYVEWVVPHLSNQTFNIIVITDAQHLDVNRSFISNIYNEVHTLDGNWSETINDQEYVRITFERNLTSSNDITIYPRIINGTPRIEIYEFNDTQIIAEFNSINNEEYNKVYLTGLDGIQDTFDLRIFDGSIEFDHIIDPTDGAPDVEFVNPTPSNGSSQSGSSIFVNVSSSDVSDHYTFVDFDNSLIGWWRMDVASSTTVFDESPSSVNGTFTGNALINNTGNFGNATWMDGTGDSIALGSFTKLLGINQFTVSAWALDRTNGSSGSALISMEGSGTADVFEFYTSTGRPLFFITNSSGTASTAVVVNNVHIGYTWHHYVGTWNGSSVTIYFDGTQGTTQNLSGYTNATFGNTLLHIGGRITGFGATWNGSIDEVLIFNRTLSAGEISSLYNASANKYQNNFTNLAQGTHIFKGYAVDTSANKNQTEQRTVTIESGDVEYPIFSEFNETTVNNTAYVSGALYRFNVTLTNTNGTVGFEFNNTNYTASNLTTTLFNASVSDLAAGTYRYYWWGYGNGSNHNFNASTSRYYTVAKASGDVEVYLNGNTANITVERGSTVTYNASLLTGMGNLNVYNNGVLVTVGVATTNTTVVNTFDSINITAIYAGNQNHSADSQTRWIDVVDTTLPQVTINFPNTTTYGTNSLPLRFNVTLNENGTVRFSLDNGLVNYTMTGDQGIFGTSFNYTNSSIVNGTYVFRVYANDTSGNNNFTESITFNFDAIAPVVTVNLPQATTYVTSAINFNVTANENATAQLSLSGGVVNYTMQNNGNRDFNYTNSSIADGSYTVTFYVNDSYNNLNRTTTTTFIIDTIRPNVTSLTENPSDPATYASGANYEFNATITDINWINTVILQFNGTNYTAQNRSSIYNVTLRDLGVGVYSYNWIANDTGGNVNGSQSGSYTIDKAASSVNLTLNGTQANLTIEANVPFLINGTLLTGDSGGTLRLYRNGTLINQNSVEVSNTTSISVLGLHNITVIYVSSQNYTQSSRTYYVNVTPESTSPEVTISIPQAITYTSADFIFNVLLNENGTVRFSLDNGLVNYTMEGDEGNYGTEFTYTNSSVPEGTYTFSVYANDTSGNRNESENVTFVVDIAESSGSSEGSSGGGGGGFVSQAESGSISVGPSEHSINVVVGSKQIRNILLTNNGNKTVTLTLSIEGIDDLAELSHSTLRLSPQEKKIVQLEVSSFDNSIRTGKVIIKSGTNVVGEQEIILNFRGGDYLFDSLIALDGSQRIIEQGDTLKAQISLLQVIPNTEVDVTANYLIEDLAGNVYLRESETFFVLNEKSFNKEFSTLGLPGGDYVLGMEIVYPGGFATSSTRFSIQPGFVERNKVPLIIVSTILLIVGLYFAFRKRLIRKL